MTAPATLPPEVWAIVSDLHAHGPSHLLDHRQTAITAAFDHGVIEVDGLFGQGHTVYKLRGRRA
jgi:hypothetical protein